MRFLQEEPLSQCFSTFVRPRPGKFFFHKTSDRSPHQNPPPPPQDKKNSRCAPGANDPLGYIPKDSLTFYELCHNKNFGKEPKRRLSPPRVDYWIVDVLRYYISVRHEVCTRNDFTEILPGDSPHQRSGKTCSYTIIGVVMGKGRKVATGVLRSLRGKVVKWPVECSGRFEESTSTSSVAI